MKSFVLISITLFLSSKADAYSLQESIQTAFDRNPRTTANRQRLEALEAEAEAAWRQLWPSVRLSYSLVNSRYLVRSGEEQVSGRTLDRSPVYGVSVNLYNGGADKLAAEAADQRAKAQAALFNSTNALIPNTRGAIANLVAKAYFNILINNESVRHLDERVQVIQVLRAKSQKSDDQVLYQNQLDALSLDLQRYSFQLATVKRDYEFVVTQPPPANLDNFDQVIESLTVPAFAPEALEVALVKSPAVLASRYSLEERQLVAASEKARLFSPRVDVGVYQQRNSSQDSLDPLYRSSVTSVSATLSWTFSPAAFPQAEASAKQIEAAQSDLSATTAELTHTVQTLYSDLTSFLKLQEHYKRNVAHVEKDIQDMLREAEQGRPVDVHYALKLLSTYDELWSEALVGKINLSNTKFLIQRTIGTLFDAVTEQLVKEQSRRP